MDFDLIGQRYVTSKCHTLVDLETNLLHLGYRGEALASIIDITGTVEITSRHHLSQRTYSKLFYHGRPTSITLSSSPRPSIGSTITLHDFFYNLPVRRKAITAILEMENIRQTIQCFSLANPSVSFSLKNDALSECVMHTKKTNSLLGSFSTLFGASKGNSMREVTLNRGFFSITGILSIESHYNKLLQFIFINGRVVRKTALHSCINNIVANSLIARHLSKQADPSKWHNQDNSDDLLSPKKATERHAVYVVMIGCPRAEYDICFDPAKTLIEFRDWEVILDLLTEVVRGFLHQHCLTLGPEGVSEEGGEVQPPLELHDTEHSNTDAGMLKKPVSMSLSCFQSEVKRMSCPTRSLDSMTIEIGKDESRKALFNGMCAVSENEMSNSMSFGGGVKSGKETVRKSVISLNRVPMSFPFNKAVQSPLHFHSLSSKLSCLLKNREQREEGQDDEGCSTHAHSTTRSHHPLQTTAAAVQPAPVDRSSSPRNSSFNCLDDRESHKIFGYPSVLSSSLGTTSTMLSLHGQAEPLDPLELMCKSSENDRIDTHEDYLLSGLEEMLSHDDVSADKDHDHTMVVGEDCNTSSDKESVSGHHCNEAAATCDETEELSSCKNINRKITLYCSNTKLQHADYSASSLWKIGYDPVTTKGIYIHNRTGKTSMVNPQSQNLLSCPPPMQMNVSNSSSTPARMVRNFRTGWTKSVDDSLCSSSNYGTACRLPLAACHPSFDFDCFLPSTKRLRIECSPPKVDFSAGVLANVGQGGERRIEEPTWEGGAFEKLLQNWKNPSFLAGQEVFHNLHYKALELVYMHCSPGRETG